MTSAAAVDTHPVAEWRRLRVGCVLVHNVPAAVHTVLQVEPHLDTVARMVNERWTLPGESTVYSDIYGNRCRRLELPQGVSEIRYEAIVDVPYGVDERAEGAGFTRAADLPSETLLYTLPSRYCPSDDMGNLAFELFARIPAGWEQIMAISEWVSRNVSFRYGSSTVQTTAAHVYEAREGVCRDLTHLFVTFCRALGFPTRYAFGYLPGIDIPPTTAVMDFCAWAEVFLEGRWYTVDPRNHGQRRTGRVVIGRGRDALDVAMVTTFGRAPLQNMIVIAEPHTTGTLVTSTA